jgi:hypothetical protein
MAPSVDRSPSRNSSFYVSTTGPYTDVNHQLGPPAERLILIVTENHLVKEFVTDQLEAFHATRITPQV